MAAAAGSLTYVLDENFGGMPQLLRHARAARCEHVIILSELGVAAGTLDPSMLRKVGLTAGAVLLTRDGAMLDTVVQRGAWREAGVTLFLFGKR